MGLRDILLKDEYRSDREDIISEFFIPCLSNCIQYNRCIEYISLKSLTTLSLGFDDFVKNKATLKIISGHRFSASDLEFISKLFSDDSLHFPLKVELIKNSKIQILQDMVQNHRLEIKIAIPNSEDVVGSFSERIGIFNDEHGDIVAFTGTSNQTFNTQNMNFESVDVFTSWNDESRVKTKIKDFENLWKNKTKYVEVYDFNYAEKNNMLKYSPKWVIDV